MTEDFFSRRLCFKTFTANLLNHCNESLALHEKYAFLKYVYLVIPFFIGLVALHPIKKGITRLRYGLRFQQSLLIKRSLISIRLKPKCKVDAFLKSCGRWPLLLNPVF